MLGNRELLASFRRTGPGARVGRQRASGDAGPAGLLLAGLLAAAVPACKLDAGAQVKARDPAERKIIAERLPPDLDCPPKGAKEARPGQYPVPKPPFSEGIDPKNPCLACHQDMPANLVRRELKDNHTEIKLRHGPRERWCFDCHDPQNRNQLRLASGKGVAFEESYLLCGQCHGPTLRDWQRGVHGRRYGSWKGESAHQKSVKDEKCYLLCAHCHNPHSPKFKPIQPLPPPRRPEDIR